MKRRILSLFIALSIVVTMFIGIPVKLVNAAEPADIVLESENGDITGEAALYSSKNIQDGPTLADGTISKVVGLSGSNTNPTMATTITYNDVEIVKAGNYKIILSYDTQDDKDSIRKVDLLVDGKRSNFVLPPVNALNPIKWKTALYETTITLPLTAGNHSFAVTTSLDFNRVATDVKPIVKSVNANSLTIKFDSEIAPPADIVLESENGYITGEAMLEDDQNIEDGPKLTDGTLSKVLGLSGGSKSNEGTTSTYNDVEIVKAGTYKIILSYDTQSDADSIRKVDLLVDGNRYNYTIDTTPTIKWRQALYETSITLPLTAGNHSFAVTTSLDFNRDATLGAIVKSVNANSLTIRHNSDQADILLESEYGDITGEAALYSSKNIQDGPTLAGTISKVVGLSGSNTNPTMATTITYNDVEIVKAGNYNIILSYDTQDDKDSIRKVDLLVDGKRSNFVLPPVNALNPIKWKTALYETTITLPLTAGNHSFAVTTSLDFNRNATTGPVVKSVNANSLTIKYKQASIEKVKVACVGDSITAGNGTTDPNIYSYPAQLQNLLGSEYIVNNYGVSGTTMLKTGDSPYWGKPEYTASSNWLPNIVVIQLGTNDSKPDNWAKNDKFVSDCVEMINHYKGLSSNPTVYVALCPTVFSTLAGITDEVVTGKVVPLLKEAASKTGCSVIDNNTLTKNMQSDTADGLHPNNVGSFAIASNVFKSICPNPENIALGKTPTASSFMAKEEPIRAMDGTVANNSKWCATNDGDKWLKYDLGQKYDITRWVVKHSGAGGEAIGFNTKDFKLQKSYDGGTWSDVDSVTNNTSNITDRSVTSFGSRYVRLYITNAGDGNVARIYEFEVYGKPVAISEKVTGITISGKDGVASITTNCGSLQMIADITPANATDISLSWSVVNTTGNEISATITDAGLLTATKDGTVKVKATAKDGSGTVSNEYTVTISGQTGKVKVACVGDSITHGDGTTNPSIYSYPAQLQKLLGLGYEVNNYGLGGKTMLKNGDDPYWNQGFYKESSDWLPDIVVIQLGTNDSKPRNWDTHKSEFVSNCVEMINHYKALSSHPTVYISLCPTVFSTTVDTITDKVVTGEVVPLLREAARQTECPVIDNNTSTKNLPITSIPDGVHPNDVGSLVVASTVFKAINNVSFGKTATASSFNVGEDPSRAMDGSIENDSKWSCTTDGDKWLKYDLGQSHAITRWVVKHSGAAGEDTALNTKDFKLQKSADGNTWIDVDSVTNNTSNITDRAVTSFNSRYVRLYITNAGSTNVARIYEFELYGKTATTLDSFLYMNFSSAKYLHSMPYRLFVPENYDPTKSYPLVLFLHGAGERGTDNDAQLVANSGATVWAEPSNQAKYPCLVVAPQCPADEQWVDTPWENESYNLDNVPASDEMKMVMDILTQVRSQYNIDSSRLYSTGISMGGYGTWNINMLYPDLFAAAIPCCGAGDPSKASRLVSKPIWAFHGADDKVVEVKGSTDMINAIKKAGGNPKYTEYPGVGHECWVNAYSDQNLIPWTFSQSNAKNCALTKTTTASSISVDAEAAKAVDGKIDSASKWCSGQVLGDKWLEVDLGQNYDITRWVVSHAGAGGENAFYNTKDFKLQMSADGNTWSDVDSVTNNTSNITDRRLVKSFNSRYVRLYITNAGAGNVARIYEFEAYGKPADTVKVTSITISGQDGVASITTTGGALQMVAVVTPANADNSLIWSVINSTSGSAIITDAGLLTAKTNGEVKVKATAKDGSGIVSNEYTVTISGQSIEKVNVSSITIGGQNGVNTITSKDGSLLMEIDVAPANADNSVIWSVVNTTGSAIISDKGLLTAKSDGAVIVKAVAKDGSGTVSNEYTVFISGQTPYVGPSGGTSSGGNNTPAKIDKETVDTTTPTPKTFSDMGKHQWAKEAVETLAAKGIISGTSEKTFEPRKSISRADFLTMLVKALNLKADFANNFADVSSDDYYYQAVGIAKQLGITSGSGNNEFNPKAEISRQDMMVLVVKALKIAGIKLEAGTTGDIAGFKDASKVSGYAANAVATLVNEGIIKGNGNAINPRSQLTRAEAAVVIYKIYKDIQQVE